MLGAVARKFFGSSNDRRVRKYQPRVDAINALEPEIVKLTDEELRARTDMFKKELTEGKSLDDILVPAFATVREAAKRTIGQRHFDVQLIGGMILHEGQIVEIGRTEQVLTNPRHEYTQRLMAAMPKMPQRLAAAKAAAL